jgi:hypothetical protein
MLVDLAEGDGEELVELIEECGLAGDQASDIGLPGHAYPLSHGGRLRTRFFLPSRHQRAADDLVADGRWT